MEDLVFKKARIIDGTSADSFKGDVYVKGDVISKVVSNSGNEESIDARLVVDAEGLFLSPGFVDTHTHSDMILLYDRQHISSLSQGVTTEILGQDGLSYAPLSKDNLEQYVKYLRGLNGDFGNSFNYGSVYEFRENYNNKVSINTAYLFPHCSLRLETVGFKDEKLSGSSLEKAKAMLRKGLSEGACGFSTGLSYFPAAYSDTEELIELCKVVSEFDSVFVTHLRTVFKGEPFDNVAEAIEIASKAKCKLHFSHYKTNRKTIGKVKTILEKITKAINEGVDITLELYPYAYGASYAAMFLPYWASDGGFEAIMQRLSDKEMRSKIAKEIDRQHIIDDAIISNLINNVEYIGLSFKDIAKLRNQTIGELICDLLYEEELAFSFYDFPGEDIEELDKIFSRDIFELLSLDNYMIGSDAILVGENPHPRAFGTFTKLLRLSREHGFRLETLINRMTQVPCSRFKLNRRGLIKPGYYADIVVFDYENVKDRSTNRFSRNLSEGINHVVVNGKLAFFNKQATGIFAGRAV